ncbi:MAG: hypothetical protein U0P81_12965 [Holophagaceae bacterium]
MSVPFFMLTLTQPNWGHALACAGSLPVDILPFWISQHRALVLLTGIPAIACVWFTVSAIHSWRLGFFRLYAIFPPRLGDPSSERFHAVVYASDGRRSMVSVTLGQACVHVREALLWRPLFWLGPASIPYDSLRVWKPGGEGLRNLLDWPEFTVADAEMAFKLSGHAGQRLVSLLTASEPAPGGFSSIRPL